ncbi:UNVERIFIED_CONTAM: hypothetical protein GTU68_041419 [Idotea baltica]|nr:hypothetical protein [Idotea baltica]
MQGLFRNPLADPGIIGVSAGSAVGAIGAITLLPKEWQPWSLSVCAFASGLISALLVYGLTVSKRGTSVLILLLSGVALSAFSGAAIGLMSYFANNQNLRELTVWQMGSLSGANATSLWITGSCMLVLAILFQLKSRTLNLLLLGESEARHLGVSVESLKIQLILLTAIGVGVSVASAGIIGFIGLVIPHLIRMLTGPNHVSLLPLSALLGATLLVISDGVARIIMPPIEFPVGLITALLGAPFFLVLLIRQRKAWG